MSKAVIEAKNISLYLRDGGQAITVLEHFYLTVQAGHSLAIVGRSGAGKSSLLHVLSGLLPPSEGTVHWHEHNVYQLSERVRCRLRNQHLGFVYQFHHLLSEFSALDNVAMPAYLAGCDTAQARASAYELLVKLGLAKRVSHKPGQLSGGERQRVAIARALVNKPACILADEPTGNLDRHCASAVYDAFLQIQAEQAASLLIVTHDLNLAQKLDAQQTLTQCEEV